MTSSMATRLIAWQKISGRHHLPWQGNDPYRVWLSEIMLQQTQVATVIPYFERFVQAFPTLQSLAAAPLDDVLALWSGLGYYSRARNLHRTAITLQNEYGGQFPEDPVTLASLPGIGRSTAAAIAVFAFAQRAAILDGNVKRVLTRWAGIDGWPGERQVENKLWELAHSLLPEQDFGSYTQGLMDLGSMLCTRSKPQCIECPLRTDCVALASQRQSELPARKTRKPLPERELVVLMLEKDNAILLERRPPAGIWGGLWSLPEATDIAGAQAYCLSRGLQVEFDTPGEVLVHVFTHFRLRIIPLAGQVKGSLALSDAQSGWFSKEVALQLGLPAPVRTLLQKLPD